MPVQAEVNESTAWPLRGIGVTQYLLSLNSWVTWIDRRDRLEDRFGNIPGRSVKQQSIPISYQLAKELAALIFSFFPAVSRLYASFFVSGLIVCRVYLPKCYDF